MKLLADENIDRPVVEKLRDKGLEVVSVDEDLKGASDRKVLKKSSDEGLVILSFDSDFSDPELTHSGVIRLTDITHHDVIVEAVMDIVQHLDSESIEGKVLEVSPNQYR